jgi:hypothetical protein
MHSQIATQCGRVLALLAIVSLSNFGCTKMLEDRLNKSKRQLTVSVMRQIENAVVQWQTAGDRPCPKSFSELVAAKVLSSEPLDGWKRPLTMTCPSKHGTEVDLVSAGADGQMGTADDIKSWELQ